MYCKIPRCRCLASTPRSSWRCTPQPAPISALTTSNFRQLGQAGLATGPKGGTLCIITAAHDTNLAQRGRCTSGAERQSRNFPPIKPEWRRRLERPARCVLDTARRCQPRQCRNWNTRSTRSAGCHHIRRPLAVLNPSAYRQTVAPYLNKLQSGQLSIIIGVGRVLPSRLSCSRTSWSAPLSASISRKWASRPIR